MDGFVVSTTSTLEGYEIDHYLGIVSAHVVAGTDVFTDIVASFSDFFGGRSRVYKRELAAIGEEAIEELREQCDRLGANGLVGVRIDHDEISGKGKSMFMVTASGTAVVASPTRKEGFDTKTHVAAGVDRDALAILLERERLLRALAAGKGGLDFDEPWSFLIRHRVFEAAPHILRNLRNREELDRHAEYFSVIPEEPAIAALYEAIAEERRQRERDAMGEEDPELEEWKRKMGRKREEAGSHYADDLLKIIDAVGLVEYNRVHAMLQSPTRDEQLLGVRLLGCSKRTYRATDVALMEECCEQVKRLFPSSAEVISIRGISGHKEMWICECGKRNDMFKPYCTKCGRSRRGVRQSEAPIDQILREVDLQISVLKKAFPETLPPI